jgi:hypothetical protein
VTSNQLVLRVIDALHRIGIDYMLVGSYSSNAYGVARSTQDADFVIELGERSITPLIQALAPELQFDPQMRLESVTMTARYVAKHSESGFKIELFMLSNDAHDRERFKRRSQQPFLNASAFLPTPEDVLVQKLRWFHHARRAKDLDDARNVLAVQVVTLDFDYIRNWCDQHGTRELFEQLLKEVS